MVIWQQCLYFTFYITEWLNLMRKIKVSGSSRNVVFFKETLDTTSEYVEV